MRSAAAALLVTLAATIATAQTRPLQTEEASTAAMGQVLVETGLDGIAGEPSYLTGVKRARFEGPLLRLVFSPADDVELDLEWVVAVLSYREPGHETVKDAGDVTLRAKWRLLGGGEKRSAFAVRFGMTLPNTSFNDKSERPLGLGPDTLRAFVDGLFTLPVRRARIHANAGILLMEEVFRPHEQSDFLSYGLAVVLPLGRGWDAMVEVAGRGGEGEPGTEQRAEARAGLRFGRGRVRGDLALRRGLTRADGTWGGTAGLTWRRR